LGTWPGCGCQSVNPYLGSQENIYQRGEGNKTLFENDTRSHGLIYRFKSNFSTDDLHRLAGFGDQGYPIAVEPKNKYIGQNSMLLKNLTLSSQLN
jgi:hypothetical protein